MPGALYFGGEEGIGQKKNAKGKSMAAGQDAEPWNWSTEVMRKAYE